MLPPPPYCSSTSCPPSPTPVGPGWPRWRQPSTAECLPRWAGRRAGWPGCPVWGLCSHAQYEPGGQLLEAPVCLSMPPPHTPYLSAVAGGRLWPLRPGATVPRRQQDPAAGAGIRGAGGVGLLQAGAATCPCMPLRLLASCMLGLPPADTAGGMQLRPVPAPPATLVAAPVHT
jgi:hypothetical protein